MFENLNLGNWADALRMGGDRRYELPEGTDRALELTGSTYRVPRPSTEVLDPWASGAAAAQRPSTDVLDPWAGGARAPTQRPSMEVGPVEILRQTPASRPTAEPSTDPWGQPVRSNRPSTEVLDPWAGEVNAALKKTGSNYQMPSSNPAASGQAQGRSMGALANLAGGPGSSGGDGGQQEHPGLMNSPVAGLAKKVVSAVAAYYTGGFSSLAMNVGGQVLSEKNPKAGAAASAVGSFL